MKDTRLKGLSTMELVIGVIIFVAVAATAIILVTKLGGNSLEQSSKFGGQIFSGFFGQFFYR